MELVPLACEDVGNVAQYPLHHVTYPGTNFEVAMSNSLGGDTLKKRERRTDLQTDDRRTLVRN